MAIGTPTDKTVFRPLTGAITRRFTVGATPLTGGMSVALGSAGIVPAVNTFRPLGIVLKSAAAGDRVDVVVFGPVNGYTGRTDRPYRRRDRWPAHGYRCRGPLRGRPVRIRNDRFRQPRLHRVV